MQPFTLRQRHICHMYSECIVYIIPDRSLLYRGVHRTRPRSCDLLTSGNPSLRVHEVVHLCRGLLSQSGTSKPAAKCTAMRRRSPRSVMFFHQGGSSTVQRLSPPRFPTCRGRHFSAAAFTVNQGVYCKPVSYPDRTRKLICFTSILGRKSVLWTGSCSCSVCDDS